jgi:hypothetical protein
MAEKLLAFAVFHGSQLILKPGAVYCNTKRPTGIQRCTKRDESARPYKYTLMLLIFPRRVQEKSTGNRNSTYRTRKK